VIGSIGYFPQADVYRFTAELGYWLSEKYWRRGFMKELIPAFTDHIFNSTEIQKVFARVFGRNIASQHLLEKCGFVREAVLKKALIKNNEWDDEVIYSFFRD